MTEILSGVRIYQDFLIGPTSSMPDATQTIAVLVPCYNEAITIAKVVEDFKAALPSAGIYVYDNNSTDGTAKVAEAAGAIVRRQPLQGKGHVVRQMFADIDADIYVLVDGDATYDASAAPAMVRKLISERLDMVNGARSEVSSEAYRAGHKLGNKIFNKTIATLFGDRIQDLLSGYRILSRRYVKSFPVQSGGFEIETEMTVHALELNLPIAEVSTDYFARPEGSVSKLSTYGDGIRIAWMIGLLILNHRPGRLFAFLAGFAAAISLLLESRAGMTADGFMLCYLLMAVAVIGASNAKRRKDAMMLSYLSCRAE